MPAKDDLQSKIEKSQSKIERLQMRLAKVSGEYAFSQSARTRQKNKIKEIQDELRVEKSHLQYLFDSMPLE